MIYIFITIVIISIICAVLGFRIEYLRGANAMRGFLVGLWGGVLGLAFIALTDHPEFAGAWAGCRKKVGIIAVFSVVACLCILGTTGYFLNLSELKTMYNLGVELEQSGQYARAYAFFSSIETQEAKGRAKKLAAERPEITPLALYFDAETFLYGYIGDDGQIKIPCQYSDARSFSGEMARVNDGEKWLFINRLGETVFSCDNYIEVQDFSYGYAPVMTKTGGYGYIDLTGELAMGGFYRYASPFYEGIACVQIAEGDEAGDCVIYIDTQGNILFMLEHGYTAVGNFSCGLLCVMDETGKFGAVDTAGNLVIPCIYAKEFSFSEELASVTKDNELFGAIDTQGNTAVTFVYHNRFSFSEGLAAVLYQGKWGYIKPDGSFAIEPQYTGCYDFHDGVAQVKIGGDTIAGNPEIPHLDDLLQSCLSSYSINTGTQEFQTAVINQQGEYIIEPFSGITYDCSNGLICVLRRDNPLEWIFYDVHGQIIFSTVYEIDSFY